MRKNRGITKMNKTLTVTYNDKTYTLEYTRKTIAMMENRGFLASQLTDKPMTLLPQLFAGAFLKNHKFTKQEDIDAIFAALPRKEDLIGKLVEMYNEPILTLVDDSENSGNADWTVNG